MNTLEQVQAQLERFEFGALFVETLGWAAASQGAQVALPKAEAFAGLSCRIMAHTATQTALEVAVPGQWQLTPILRQQIFAAVAQRVPGPLLIFVSAGSRSLWLWAEPAGQVERLTSQIYIKGQPGHLWAKRLLHLCQTDSSGSNETSPPENAANTAEPAWEASLRRLADGVQGISRRSDRNHYALVVFCRLLALLPLQQAGWLDQGDEWYLQNRFGQSQQQGPDRFFREVLQPLWFQGLALPPQERPPHLSPLLGEVPFLPTGPFRLHPLEQQYSQIQIADGAFEPALEWLGDLAVSVPVGQLAEVLAPLFERYVNEMTGRPGDLVWVTPPPILAALCDRTLRTAILRQADPVGSGDPRALEDLLMGLKDCQTRQLLEQLVDLAILDPACGSGRYLLALLQRLAGICEILAAIVQSTAAELPSWLGQGWPNLPLAPTLTLEWQILKGSFYGVDLSEAAIELARLQFFLHLVGQLPQPQGLSKLPDLSLNLLRGNALVGLVKVDSERFDQIQGKPQTAPGESADESAETAPVALQGNLLQPLLAEDYRSSLAERQIRLEHYRDQTHLFSEVNGIPGYVQAEFLRDRIAELNRIAQTRLNQLLLNEFSQQLGIRYRQIDRQGRQQRRLLSKADIAALHPFHWGFYGHQLLAERGGFDVVICQPPWGPLQGSAEGFFAAFEDLFERKGITLEAFCHHRKQLLTIDADLATAWRDYSAQFTYLSDYFRRVPGYRHSAQPPPTQTQMRLYKARLLLERAQQLLRPGGIGAFLLPADLWHQDNAERLRAWLHSENRALTVVEISNHQGALGAVPPRTALSLLWLEKAETAGAHSGEMSDPAASNAARTDPSGSGQEASAAYFHAVYQGQNAPTPEALSGLLDCSIDLGKERFEVG